METRHIRTYLVGGGADAEDEARGESRRVTDAAAGGTTVASARKRRWRRAAARGRRVLAIVGRCWWRMLRSFIMRTYSTFGHCCNAMWVRPWSKLQGQSNVVMRDTTRMWNCQTKLLLRRIPGAG
jgi:hypothetical protein